MHPGPPGGAGRRSFPWWGVAPALVPWAWFLVQSRGGPVDLIAVALPGIGLAAGVAGAALLALGGRVAGVTAVSLLAVCLTATLLPRIPQRTPTPSSPIRIASANTYELNLDPSGAARALVARHADVMVSVETSDNTDAALTSLGGYPFVEAASGQRVASRWPLSALTTPAGLPASRVLRVEADTPAGPVTVYAVHAPNPFHEVSFTQQRRFVRALLRAVDTERDPTIVVGDLNLSDRTSGYRLIEASMRDAMRSGTWAPSTYLHFLWRLLMLRIDHLFVPAGWCAADPSTFDVPGSDHHGIDATVGPCPSPAGAGVTSSG